MQEIVEKDTKMSFFVYIYILEQEIMYIYVYKEKNYI